MFERILVYDSDVMNHPVGLALTYTPQVTEILPQYAWERITIR